MYIVLNLLIFFYCGYPVGYVLLVACSQSRVLGFVGDPSCVETPKFPLLSQKWMGRMYSPPGPASARVIDHHNKLALSCSICYGILRIHCKIKLTSTYQTILDNTNKLGNTKLNQYTTHYVFHWLLRIIIKLIMIIINQKHKSLWYATSNLPLAIY